MRPAIAVDYAKFYSRSHTAVIRVYDKAGDVIQTNARTGELVSAAAAWASR
jgi:hypothetical protein